MKFWKLTLISTLAFFGIASTVLYSACTDDSCTRLKCRNKGTCTDGYCHCPSGYEGSQCEVYVNVKFWGRYYGATRCSNTPEVLDSAVVSDGGTPDKIWVYDYSTRDSVLGVINGNTALFNTGDGRNIRLTLENNKITFYVGGAGGNDSLACNFIGSK